MEQAPICCENGWRLAFCHSRYLHSSELNYAPIEGEALFVAWALKKGRLFLLGCKKLLIVVDHQPLVKIFGDKALNDIENHRLQNFKEKSLPYSFDIKYVKGIRNHANVFSRYPVGKPDAEDIMLGESLEIASLSLISNISVNVLTMTVEDVKKASKDDSQYQLLVSKVQNSSFAESFTLENEAIKEFYNVRDRLCIVDDLLMYGYDQKCLRIVIPQKLRRQIILNLHAANQGATSLLSRARQSVYWPGMDRDITVHIDQWHECHKMAPSQQKEPLINAPIPEYPFQNVVADLFQINECNYLAYADRLTGFIELAHFPSSTASSNIINTLRECFHRWGVAEEISLDGGKNLQSNETQNWLKAWGVRVRLSSAYYPQSNGRAEAAVKSLNRLLQGNTGKRGSINTDDVAQALLQYRNTPLREINKSPAELALGRTLRDSIPLPQSRYRVDPQWAQNLQQREITMSKSNEIVKTKYDKNAKTLEDLVIGDNVYCQNTRSGQWDRSGTIVMKGEHRQYSVKMDGSGRVSLRNRRHLRKIHVHKSVVPTLKPLLKEAGSQLCPSVPQESSSSGEPVTEAQSEVPVAVGTPTIDSEAVVRRSTRRRQPPLRYPDIL